MSSRALLAFHDIRDLFISVVYNLDLLYYPSLTHDAIVAEDLSWEPWQDLSLDFLLDLGKLDRNIFLNNIAGWYTIHPDE